MAGILDDLANAYGTAGSTLWDAVKPYLAQQNPQSAGTNLTNALQYGGGDAPMSIDQTAQANAAQGLNYVPPSAGLLAPMGYGSANAMPPPSAMAGTPTVAPVATTPADAGGGGVGNLPTNLPVATGTPDVTADQGGTTDQTQGSGPGILQSIMSQGAAASQSPEDSKSFLSKLSDGLSEMGDKLTHLSPAASQGLISAGLGMLAANSGGRNLAQIVGMGGEQGMNTYQTIVQNQIAAQLKQRELAQNLWEKQQDIALRAAEPHQLEPGKPFYTIAGGLQGTGGGLPVSNWLETKNADGTVTKTPVGYDGRVLGPGYVADASIPQAQQKNIQDAVVAQGTATDALNRTQNYISMLQPQIKDANGNMVANPNYVSLPGGLTGEGYNFWTKITGNQQDGQVLAQQIMRDARANAASMAKQGIGGRITQGEYNTIMQGLPTNPSNEALTTYLQAVGHLQQIQAQRASTTAEYLQQNRGMYGTLNHDSTIGGQQYKAGTALNDIVAGTATPTGAGGGSAGTAPAPGPAPTPSPATPTPSTGRTINVGGKQYTQNDIDQAIAWKRAHPNG